MAAAFARPAAAQSKPGVWVCMKCRAAGAHLPDRPRCGAGPGL